MRRRRFLELGGAGALALMGGCRADNTSSDDSLPITGPWGVASGLESQALVPVGQRPEAVLEVFLMGGFNAWDTFYVAPEHGDPKKGGLAAGTQWWTFQEGLESVPETFAEGCGYGDTPLLQHFGTDSVGRDIHLGPWVAPLRDRPDILNRMRVVVMSHDQAPHEAAVPLFLSGQPRGTTRMASTGSHVERFWQDQAPRTSPYSYVLYPNSDFVAGFNVESAFALGQHPGRARPLAIRITDNNPLAAQLRRERLGGKASKVDALVEHYLQAYERALTGSPSRGLSLYGSARRAMASSEGLARLIDNAVLAPIPGESCGASAHVDGTAMGLKLAAHLLTAKEERARYVHLIDAGIDEAQDGGYDTHQYHVRDTSKNMLHFCQQLSAVVNRPGEADPGKLDLDKHQILLTTEMGRTPFVQVGTERGLDHWPYGFVCVVIGGVINEDRSGVIGAVAEDGRATESVSPAELRAAMLLMQGIWPFQREAFDRADMGFDDELAAAMAIRARVLGFGA